MCSETRSIAVNFGTLVCSYICDNSGNLDVNYILVCFLTAMSKELVYKIKTLNVMCD